MTDRATRGLFVTGTDTDVGKTYVTSGVVRTLRADSLVVGAYKPVCSGAEKMDGQPVWHDVQQLLSAVEDAFPRERICPQTLIEPLAPPVAARAEGRVVDESLVRSGLEWWLGRVDVLLVEGVGGLLCPLTTDGTIADFAAFAGFPLLIVARSGLGTINHTLLTIEAARGRGLRVAGVLLNDSNAGAGGDESIRTNAAEIERYGEVVVLGHVPRNAHLRGSRWMSTISWCDLVEPRRCLPPTHPSP